jgi:nicotinamidase/pyrazinamidase
MKLKKALLVVDVQNDFCPGGALPVPQGNKVVPVLNKYIRMFVKKQLPVFASRDWHPRKTAHFKRFGGSWPVHCVQGTGGADFYPGLKLPKEAVMLYKGMDPREDSYSVFQAQDPNGMSFFNLLQLFGVEELSIGGLATDYCVKASVLDALKNGFKVRLLTDAIRGVNVHAGDAQKALGEMVAAGARKTAFRQPERKT